MNALRPQSHGQSHNGYHVLSSSSGSSEGIDIESSTKEAECNHREGQRNTSLPRHSSSSKVHFLILANLLIFMSSVVLFVSIPYRSSNQLNEALKQVLSYCMATRSLHIMPSLTHPLAPILDEVEIGLVDKQVQGTLFPGPDPLLGRRAPGPETDEEWQNYEIQRNFVLSRDQVEKLGKDPAKTAKYPEELFGFGDEAYIGGMDIFHQIHCFDAIRKEAFKDYYWDGERYHLEMYGPETGPPKRKHSEIFWLHLRHCTDIILQSLMCSADAGMTTYMWLETQEKPFPDFSVNRKCTNFDALEQWRNENAVDIDQVAQVRKPEGANETPIGDLYWKLYGNETSAGDMTHHPAW